jgi:hypothetical protein
MPNDAGRLALKISRHFFDRATMAYWLIRYIALQSFSAFFPPILHPTA